ncbi:MAG: hypothetical protein LBR69_05860 [Endomicrobium sp.]|jgi:hypothetical protein|nr:hypothetical protein [Endomicrobium sp.]
MKLKIIFLLPVLIAAGILSSCASSKINAPLKDGDKPFKISAEDKKAMEKDAEITEIK